jgi:trigger factor
MATQLESLSALERKLSLLVSLNDVNAEAKTRLRKIGSTLRMPGFRPGKVPSKMVEQSYGPQVQSEVLGDAVSKAFSDGIKEHNLRVAGDPKIDRQEAEVPEGHVGFSATFEVYPDLVLKDAAALASDRYTCSVTEADVDRTVEVLRKQRVQWESVDRAAASGDRVTMDFTGRMDGVEFDGGKASDFPFVMGEGRMLPDFEVGVNGCSIGTDRVFPVAFPADYGSKDLAGKTAEFTVSIKKVEAPILPVVDEAFAKGLGIQDGGVDKMRADVRKNLDREVTQRLRSRTKSAAMDQLASLADFALPQALVLAEQGRLVEMAKADLQQRGINPEQVPIPTEAFKEQAEKRVRLGLIVAELVKVQKLQAKPDQIRAQIEEAAQSYENPAEVVRWYFSDKQRLSEVEAMVLEQNVVDWLLSKATVTDKGLSFEELTAAGQ